MENPLWFWQEWAQLGWRPCLYQGWLYWLGPDNQLYIKPR